MYAEGGRSECFLARLVILFAGKTNKTTCCQWATEEAHWSNRGESLNGLQRDVRMLRTDATETHTELHTERVAIFSHTAAVKVKGKTGTQLSDLASTSLTLPIVPSESCCELLISRQSDHK